ncbi:hypothetical protein ARMGADRAFT_127229 [Armillaria gallica]|uniref:Uncharacterized protein n=1 Tax=Armillaria gallica TaxID=47427 RepID=A0A2H3DE83_ARMGA|nr:hypothetical protein ARMGADRAFT_127229 [Armillaria gallica]
MDVRGGYHNSSLAQYNRGHEYASTKIEGEPRPQDRNIFRIALQTRVNIFRFNPHCCPGPHQTARTSVLQNIFGPRPTSSNSGRTRYPHYSDVSIARLLHSDYHLSTRQASYWHSSKPAPGLSGTYSAAMPHRRDSSDLPPEIYDAIIDELQDDKRSLLRVSLTCRALCPRTRVHLFSSVSLYNESSCSRLRELIAMSPNLAPHFKSLCISIMSVEDQGPKVYGALIVIKSLVNLTQLTLAGGDWSQLPHTVVSSLQSHSYRSLEVYAPFCFRAIGDICSLVQNSPDLQRATFACENDFTGDCHLTHSLHRTSAPVELHISDLPGSSVTAETLLKMATSLRSCPFSFSHIHTLNIALSGQSCNI